MVIRIALLALAACSSNKPRAIEDATTARPPADAAPASDAAAPITTAKTGDLQVRVEWRDVPVAMRASPGRTPCRTPRTPVVAPTTTWGIPEVLVVIDGAAANADAAPARIVLQDCVLAPRVVGGRSAVLESATLQPATVTLARRGAIDRLDALEQGTPRPIQLPIAGHAVSLPLDDGGIYELAAGGETAWIAASPGAVVTEANGQVLVKDLAPGKYDVRAWLPPRAGGAPKLARGSATVTAGDLAELVLELK